MAEGGGGSLVQGLPLWADILLSGSKQCQAAMHGCEGQSSALPHRG